MRKKRLLNEIEIIIAKNDKLYLRCRELEEQLATKDKSIAELESRISELEARCSEAEKYSKEEPAFDNEKSEHAELTGNCDEPVIDDIDDVLESSNEITPDESADNAASAQASSVTTESDDILNADTACDITPISHEAAINAASESIGRVVLRSATVCNKFAAVGDINSKDLINLALGQTEVFKSDILSLISENMTEQRFSAELKSREAAVYEYFDLLLHQIQ